MLYVATAHNNFTYSLEVPLEENGATQHTPTTHKCHGNRPFNPAKLLRTIHPRDRFSTGTMCRSCRCVEIHILTLMSDNDLDWQWIKHNHNPPLWLWAIIRQGCSTEDFYGRPIKICTTMSPTILFKEMWDGREMERHTGAQAYVGCRTGVSCYPAVIFKVSSVFFV